ncbi:hypothetical protein DFP72DRAFT_1070183 [Ephemerocybe angulata]|uniref:PARP catalytic domain-containing protein n=1 Tax=Ephemerocybe angulata TaxID=980116 RepID=A0A8H6M219_9AGAR|nr:hypothetical protein DFP72DRAFT_1070183 [Tulosesus angulatus]
MHVVVDISGDASFHLCTDTPEDLVHIPPSDDDHQRISNIFNNAWKHPKPFPKIHNVFYVAHHSADALAHISRFSNYSNKVGNTQLLFHGTPRTCLIGTTASPAHTRLCERLDCSLCLILRESYDIEKAKSARMFGTGIYSTNVSSKADLYASPRRLTGRATLKSVILNHVVLGRTQLMLSADQSLQHAPDIYNSVTGATSSEGGALAYHEAVVYREDAMCASAVIFYE